MTGFMQMICIYFSMLSCIMDDYMIRTRQRIAAFIGLLILGGTLPHLTTLAQELTGPAEISYRAKITEIINEDIQTGENNGEVLTQELQARILSSSRRGETIDFTNQFINEDLRLDQGDRIFIVESIDPFYETPYYYVSERDRTATLALLFAIFLLVVIGFAGKQGLRSLLGLAGSFLAVGLILIPGLLRGWSPILLSLIVGVIILVFAIIVTHGWRRSSWIALGGTAATLVITIILALLAVELTEVTGFISEEATFLNFNTLGTVNIKGLLLGGILIGVLGVLDDIAITQVAVVKQLWSVNPDLSRGEVFRRAISVGRDHMSSLVNTLILAYLGVGLPTVMLLRTVDAGFFEIINQESVTAEIIRMLVGSIGLILCVPITTWIAIRLYRPQDAQLDDHDHTHACGHVHAH